MTSPTSEAAHAVHEARARLRASLDALSDHLSPGGALDLARSIIEDQEARQSAADFVKRNPVPTALAATGLAWMGYKLLSGDRDLADPARDPGLTEVEGRPVVPRRPAASARATAPVAPVGAPEPVPGRQDVPRTPDPTLAGPTSAGPTLAGPTLPHPTQTGAPAVESSGADRALAKARGVRRTFARHPLLYGVVGLLTGAVVGVIAALRGGRDDAVEGPADPHAAPEVPMRGVAADEQRAPGNGVYRRPPAPDDLHAHAN